MPTVKLNGVDLYYEMGGAGERLVLTHGSWTDHTGWAPSLRRWPSGSRSSPGTDAATPAARAATTPGAGTRTPPTWPP